MRRSKVHTLCKRGMSQADWATLTSTLRCQKKGWVRIPRGLLLCKPAPWFRRCTLLCRKTKPFHRPSGNETLPLTVSPAGITFRSHQRAPQSMEYLPALNTQWYPAGFHHDGSASNPPHRLFPLKNVLRSTSYKYSTAYDTRERDVGRQLHYPAALKITGNYLVK